MSEHEYAVCPDCGMKDVTIQSAPRKPDRMHCLNCRWNSLDGSSDDTDATGDLVTDGGTEQESAGGEQKPTISRRVVRQPETGDLPRRAGVGVAYDSGGRDGERFRVEQLWPDGRAEPVYVGEDDALELARAITKHYEFEVVRDE